MQTHRRSGLRFGVLWCLAVTPLAGQTPSHAPDGSISERCRGENHRALDFWLGEWDVTGPDGARAGHNVIARAQAGCLVTENWTSAGGTHGQSMNFYSPTTASWHQVWVDEGGTVLMLQGTPAPGSMIWDGETRTERGALKHRITLTRRDADTVHQLWEMWPVADTSAAARQVAFDGVYRRR